MRGKNGGHVPVRNGRRAHHALEEMVDQAISTYLVKGYRMSEDPDRRVPTHKG
jgi:hypothetical protein